MSRIIPRIVPIITESSGNGVSIGGGGGDPVGGVVLIGGVPVAAKA